MATLMSLSPFCFRNHNQMSVLTTVDVSDVSPLDSVCSQAFLEQVCFGKYLH